MLVHMRCALGPEATSASAPRRASGAATVGHSQPCRSHSKNAATACGIKIKWRRRSEVNAWILNGRVFDAVVDLDAVLRDPSHPTGLLPSYDSGDHLHPNNAGYVAAGKACFANFVVKELLNAKSARESAKDTRSPLH
jgi:hypothetical protein